MKHFVTSCSLFIMMMICCQMASAQIPRTLSYQGVLTDSLGTPKPDGSYGLTFRLYDAESGGSALWTEAKTLDVQRGLFSTQLGDQVAFGSGLKFDKQYWLDHSGREPAGAVAADSAVGCGVQSELIEGGYAHDMRCTLRCRRLSIARGLPGRSRMGPSRPRKSRMVRYSLPTWRRTEPRMARSSSGTAAPGLQPRMFREAEAVVDGRMTDRSSGLRRRPDTVALNTTSRLGKLNINGDIGLNLTSSLYFGGPTTRISGMIGGDLRFVAEDLTALTTEDITFGHYGDETWIGFNNSSKHVGIGTLDPVDRLHVVNDSATSCWIRVESSHPSQWGQAGLRIKTPENLWQPADGFCTRRRPALTLQPGTRDARDDMDAQWLGGRREPSAPPKAGCQRQHVGAGYGLRESD